MEFRYSANMDILEALEKIGLKDKQAGVYLALLELGTASVESIAKKAGTKRPTTYLILDELQSRGLVSIVPRAKKTLYSAESPQLILSEIGHREELLKRFMPNLLAVYNTRKEKPQVLLFEGKEGVGQVYDKIFSSPEVQFFSTIRDVFVMFPEMSKLLSSLVNAKQIKIREILTQTPADLEYIGRTKQGEHYQSRLAPKKFPEFLSDSAIFGNSVAFFSFKPQVFAVQIDSREISQSLRVLFDLAWLAAEPYEKVIHLAKGRESVK